MMMMYKKDIKLPKKIQAVVDLYSDTVEFVTGDSIAYHNYKFITLAKTNKTIYFYKEKIYYNHPNKEINIDTAIQIILEWIEKT